MSDGIIHPEGAVITVIDDEVRSTNPNFGLPQATIDASNNALGAIIPTAKGRKIAYAVYAGASLIVTNTAVGFAAIHADFPAWLTISIAVIGNLAAPFGAIAIANASNKK